MNYLRALLLIPIAWMVGYGPPLEPLGRFDARNLPEASGIVRSLGGMIGGS